MPRSATVLSCLLLLTVSAAAAGPADAGPAQATDEPAKLDAAEQEALLDEALAAWAKRRALFQSVAYVIEGEDRYPKGSLTFGDPLVFMPPPPGGVLPVTPAEDYDAPVRCEVALDFAGRRFRCERSFETFVFARRAFRPAVRIGLRDGDQLVELAPRDRNPAAGPTDAQVDYDKRSGALISEATPLLYAHGYVDDGSGDRLGDFSATPAKEEFEVIGLASHQGCDCLVLQSEVAKGFPGHKGIQRELWIDLARDAAVVRRLYISDGHRNFDAVTEFVYTAGTWLPSAWTTTAREADGTVSLVLSRSVLSRKASPDLGNVSFQAKPQIGDLFRKDFKLWRDEGPDKPPLEIDDGRRNRGGAGRGIGPRRQGGGGVDPRKPPGDT